MVVKENQSTLHAEIVTLFADPDTVMTQASEPTAHSQRVEHHCLRASTELTGDCHWPGLTQVLCMERRVTHLHTGKPQHERAYAVISLLCVTSPSVSCTSKAPPTLPPPVATMPLTLPAPSLPLASPGTMTKPCLVSQYMTCRCPVNLSL